MTSLRSALTAAAAVIGLIAMGLVWAGTYKWVDDHGVTHYGETPPPGVSAEPLAAPAPPPQGTDAAREDLKTRLEAAEKARQARQEEEAKAAKERAQAEKLKQDCQKTRKNLNTLKNRNRVLIKEGDGYRVMPAEERQKKIDRLETWLAENC
ncbi:MAG: DUF4124 domain-containing protein [Gammaproteobacteria bacterium]|nr:DUF4124 domain-containing protein [Gammaproteobacteria bacterium]NIR97003.1 DUF4124 domain-containing protein [Gammaproteobacteria bacterium]NIV19661.1 DUF4124 domain-containing protein [Gammaproteobacteria bacterium]